MDVRGRLARGIVAVGGRVRSSDRLRWLLSSLGLAGPARAAYSWCVERAFADDVTVDVAGVSASFPSVAPAHLTNELPVLKDFVREVRARDADVWDVGAAVGLYAVPAAKATRGQVVAFEPFEPQYERLLENASANDVEGVVDLHTVALGDERDSRPFDADDASIGPDGDGDPVEIWPGDDFLEEHDVPAPDVVKVDVEGAEAATLRGLGRTLGADGCEVVYVEVHPDRLESFGDDAASVHDLLTDAGFAVERLASSSDGRYAIKAVAG